MSGYTVRYERDRASGWWVAQVKEAPAAITQGRTIAEARRRIREALALALDDDRAAEKARIVDDVKLPADAARAVQRAQAERKRLEIEARRARATTAMAVQKLNKLGLSVRDAGELLGTSYQRVQQLARNGRRRAGERAALNDSVHTRCGEPDYAGTAWALRNTATSDLSTVPAATPKTSGTRSSGSASSQTSFSPRNAIAAARPTRLLPSTNGWLRAIPKA